MSQEFHFILEACRQNQVADANASTGLPGSTELTHASDSGESLPRLVLPFGSVNFLSVSEDGTPCLDSGRPHGDRAIALEATWMGRRPVVAMMHSSRPSPRVNGTRAPLATGLWERDILQVPGCPYLLHVCVHSEPEIGPPRPEVVGELCPYCKTEILADSRVYHCQCGKATHLEEEEGRESEEALLCARLAGRCISCNRALMLVKGYTYLPGSLTTRPEKGSRYRRRGRRQRRDVT